MSLLDRSQLQMPVGMGIGDLTNMQQSQNQVKECPELTTLKTKYHGNLDVLEHKIQSMSVRMNEEISQHLATKEKNTRLEHEVEALESRIQEETQLIAEVTEARRVLHRVSTLEQDNKFLKDTVEGLKMQIEQNDTDRILKAQLFAAREENRELHEDIDKSTQILKVERQKQLILEDVSKGVEARAIAAEGKVRELEQRLREMNEEQSESRGLFLHGAHMAINLKKRASSGPVVTDSGGTVLGTSSGEVVEKNLPDIETQRLQAQARISSYRAKQGTAAKVHNEWKAPKVSETVKETAIYKHKDQAAQEGYGKVDTTRPKSAVVRRGRPPLVRAAENEHVTYYDVHGKRISEAEVQRSTSLKPHKSNIRSMASHANLGGIGGSVH